jgi:hypothetical protein
VSVRSRVEGASRAEYLREFAAEQAEEQRQREEADPVLSFQRSADTEAEQTREVVLHGVLSDEYLSKFGTIVREPFTEGQVETALEQFKNSPSDFIRTKANAAVITEFLWRNNISPAVCSSYKMAHEILKLWNGYPDEVAPQPVVAEAQPTQPATKRYGDVRARDEYLRKVVVVDPIDGKKYTESDLSRAESKTELRLRRIMEGKIGNNLYDEFIETQNQNADVWAKLNQVEEQ